ncbi:MAG: DUF2177 family protein [Pseudomonadota bacterium]
MSLIIAYVATAITFFAVDIAWLGFVAKSFYRDQLSHLIADPFNMTAAVLFYLVYIAGIVWFAVRPALASGAVSTAALNGALFGFFCYATYNFTNLATLRDWPVKMTMVDLTWGTTLTAICATMGYLGARHFG